MNDTDIDNKVLKVLSSFMRYQKMDVEENKTEQIIAELDQNHWINQVIQEIELLLHNSTELFQINIKFAGLYRCIEEIRSFGKIRIL